VLSHPLLVEAIEDEFIPFLVYNNRSGQDAIWLEQFQESSWNYQVLRFWNSRCEDILPRKDKVWSLAGVVSRMIEALNAAQRAVPLYLQNLLLEHSESQSASFAMYCFWTGEFKLGQIPGVLETEAGWIEGREVTQVRYSPLLLSFSDLVEKAQHLHCAEKVFASPKDYATLSKKISLPLGKKDSSYQSAKASDQKKQLEGTLFENFPLTPYQKTKINAFLRVDFPEALRYLSPRQLKEFEILRKKYSQEK
jgi:hypothetical protein